MCYLIETKNRSVGEIVNWILSNENWPPHRLSSQLEEHFKKMVKLYEKLFKYYSE